MRTIVAFGFAVVLGLLTIGAWSSATTHSVNRAETSAASISPLELMKNSKNLVHEQYDVHAYLVLPVEPREADIDNGRR